MYLPRLLFGCGTSAMELVYIGPMLTEKELEAFGGIAGNCSPLIYQAIVNIFKAPGTKRFPNSVPCGYCRRMNVQPYKRFLGRVSEIYIASL